MAKRLSILVALGALLAGTAAAQDVERVLRAAADAMGDPSNVTYSGTGWVANIGQSYTPDDDWPRFEVTTYTRTIDYDDRSSREEYTRRQGNYPPQGGGAPLQGEQRRVFLTSGDYSWNMNGPNPAPQPAAAEVRQPRYLDVATRISEGGGRRKRRDGSLVDAPGSRSDDRVLHSDGQIPRQRHDQ